MKTKMNVNMIFSANFLMCMAMTTVSSIAEPERPGKNPAGENSASQTWQNWVQEYDQDRRSNDGWLSLTGLYWLVEGENSLGSAEHHLHRFPAGTPADFGSITLTDGRIFFTRFSDDVRIEGEDIASRVLLPDETTVSLGSYSFRIIKREKGFAIRLKNVDNPAIASFTGTRFYPYSESWAIPARLVKHSTPQKISIATVYATVRENDSAGWLEFDYEGRKLRLQAVSYGPELPMMVMFADATSRETTYGAGRFLDVEWPAEGDVTTIDFNRAYSPPCAITEFATCPLPPPQNRMNIAVEAGELYDSH